MTLRRLLQAHRDCSNLSARRQQVAPVWSHIRSPASSARAIEQMIRIGESHAAKLLGKAAEKASKAELALPSQAA